MDQKPIVVLKFGGTSLSDADTIRNSAKYAIREHETYRQVIVVVSAMAGETNRLLSMGRQFGHVLDTSRQREFDALVSTGEQVSAALMAMAIQEKGVAARSLTAHQIKIHTDNRFQSARIISIDSSELLRVLQQNMIAVVTGFQGIDSDGNIVTLGRGGSDTTAVALAVALNADSCKIYTDVKGVYTTDPTILPKSRLLKTLFFEEMIELASSGAKVLQIRSVELAMKNNMEIHVRSSISETPGTRVISERKGLETLTVTAIAHDDNQAKIAIVGLENYPDILSRVLEPLANANIVLDLITQNVGVDGKMTVSFTINECDLEASQKCLDSAISEGLSGDIFVERKLVKISAVGIGMRTHSGIAHKVFKLLNDQGIPILMGLSTEIKVSCIIPAEFRNQAIAVLHEGLELYKLGQ